MQPGSSLSNSTIIFFICSLDFLNRSCLKNFQEPESQYLKKCRYWFFCDMLASVGWLSPIIFLHSQFTEFSFFFYLQNSTKSSPLHYPQISVHHNLVQLHHNLVPMHHNLPVVNHILSLIAKLYKYPEVYKNCTKKMMNIKMIKIG